MSRKLEFQMRVLKEQLAGEQILFFEYGGFVSDRSVLDVIAYMMFYGIPDDFIEKKRKKALKYAAANYDLLVYTPIIETEVANDGFRFTDKDSQLTVDVILKSLISDLPNLFILSNSRKNWVNEVMKILRKKFSAKSAEAEAT